MKEPFRRLIASLCFPIGAFWVYWRGLNRALERGVLDGEYSIALLWCGVVSLILIVAIYLYIPLTKKAEPGSIVSYVGIFLAVIALLIGNDLEWSEFSTEIEKLWGRYIFWMVYFLSLTNMAFRSQHYKFSAFGRPIPIEDEKGASEVRQ